MSGLSSKFILYMEDTEDATNRPTVYEATQYHDLLEEMMQTDWMKQVSHDTRIAIMAFRDTLCFSLGHDNNENFPANLERWAEEWKEYMQRDDHFDN